MSAIAEKTVRELALESSAATRVFEKLGIDYCCGGDQSLGEACHSRNLSLELVQRELDSAQQESRPAGNRDWQREPLSELIAHISATHHKFVRSEIARLAPLFEKVCGVHGKNHSELLHIQAIFRGLGQELTAHLMKEEMVLFPYIVRMEEAVIQGEPALPASFGTVANPVAMMEHEHDSAGDALRAMRATSNGYTAPDGACTSYQALYRALAEFEADLHQHIHLENNILFPRAIAMETKT
ncbi:MAG: iron-sulfur cluster repair di-iron protein [Candidatus Sulfotelmatobacter sp.]